LFGLSNLDIEKELYQEAFSYKGDDLKSRKFAKKLSRLIQVHELPDGFVNSLQNEIRDEAFIEETFREILRERLPNIANNRDLRYELEFLNNANFKIHTNVDTKNNNVFTVETPILATISAIEDMQVMANNSSEISLPEFNATILRHKANQILKKSGRAKQEIDSFNRMAFDESWALREAINSNRIHVKAILKTLDKAAKYKEWLQGIEDDANIIREYIAKVEEKSILEELPSKAVRFYIVAGLGMILGAVNSIAAITVSTALTAFDTFFLENLGKKWKPNQFIENELRPLVKNAMKENNKRS
jgi:hypothetical protein